MIRYLLVRLALLVPTLLGVLAVTFALLYLAPGDPVASIVGERADSATVARVRAELKLDDPVPVRFGRYVAGVAQGDLGRSYITRRPIASELAQRFPATLKLAAAAVPPRRYRLWQRQRAGPSGDVRHPQEVLITEQERRGKLA